MNYSLSYSYEVHRIFYLLPLTCSLLPAPCSLKARTKVPHDYDNCYMYYQSKLKPMKGL
ncbi:hypothetical protein [Moorena sp. SIO4A5]|uniref:hypothetical protein n=1 Tax=Moorena sp. SIO4A5 TaxID=2607838 RepID=UPI0013CBC8A8|nr:hypothetical protein [Moorena sp. SIO4A5]NEO22378.1 hypothetical protein [Moorena sp. SIO4A5]